MYAARTSTMLSLGVLAFSLACSLFATAESPSQNTAGPEPAAPSFIKDGEIDVDAAVAYFEELYRSDSSVSDIEMTVTRPRRSLTMRMTVQTQGQDKALIVLQSPPRDKDTATLKVDKNLWNYMPKIKRTIRVPPSMMLASWMGSDFTNDDLVKESSLLDDYTCDLVGESEDPKGWRIRFDAKPGLVGLWNRFELILSEDGTLPLQAEYYDRKDRLSRTMYWADVKVMDGKRLPSKMTLIPEDEEGHKTELKYHDIDFDVDLPANTFSLSRLEQKR